MPRYRKQVWFDGRVQGVGFRYKAVQLSKSYDVTGTVRNIDSGRVHLIACGEKSEVNAFIDDLKKTMADYIRETEEFDDSTELKYTGFQIEL